jgi:hypothetical protein
MAASPSKACAARDQSSLSARRTANVAASTRRLSAAGVAALTAPSPRAARTRTRSSSKGVLTGVIRNDSANRAKQGGHRRVTSRPG